ncbi:receptor-interacting serine/threonine-protein kinase 4-like [Saccostrea echinata]|uniref:receptor-interacting serine/threonine-protein kinase 4-like n=1 Tax=Saccostrea echinata TaxID=191078 RepID=UPI002A81AFDE|nr:receptor-interacting serine/threonine-protein kinase 4-like [Saccostrea echinata]
MDIVHERSGNHSEELQSAPQNINTPVLHTSTENGDFERTKLLLEKSPSKVNDIDDRGWCSLHIAAEKGDLRIFQLLVDKGANPSCSTNAILTTLHIACLNAKYDMCHYILLNFPFLIKNVDNRLWNAAHFAAQGGDIRILQLLAEKGLAIKESTKNKCTILHIACRKANYEMSQYILSKHPELLDNLNEFGWRAAHYAAKGGNIRILQLLKDKGVSLKLTTENKETLLHIACLYARYEICQFLLSVCPDNLQDVDEQGWNATHFAAQGGDIRILQLLTDNTLSLKETTHEKCSILHIACSNARYDMCKHILNVLPEILHDVNEWGWNAAHYAAQGGDVRILQLLAEKGSPLRGPQKINVLFFIFRVVMEITRCPNTYCQTILK